MIIGMAITALVLAALGLMAAGGMMIALQNHEARQHPDRQQPIQEDTGSAPDSKELGCIHSVSGCPCYQSGYTRGREWKRDEREINGPADTHFGEPGNR